MLIIIFTFLPAVKHRYEPFENITLTKNGFNKVQNVSQDNPKKQFFELFNSTKTFP